MIRKTVPEAKRANVTNTKEGIDMRATVILLILMMSPLTLPYALGNPCPANEHASPTACDNNGLTMAQSLAVDVPEPGAFALIGLGAAGLVIARVARSRKR